MDSIYLDTQLNKCVWYVRKLGDVRKLGLSYDDPSIANFLDRESLTGEDLEKYIESVEDLTIRGIKKFHKLPKNSKLLYTLKIDEELICHDKDYLNYLEGEFKEKIFKDTKTGICHLCGNKDKVSNNTTWFKILKFFNTDKQGFANGLTKENFIKNFSFCLSCYEKLLAGQSLIVNKLRAFLNKKEVFILPTFLVPPTMLNIADL